jgi:hypothetical protein
MNRNDECERAICSECQEYVIQQGTTVVVDYSYCQDLLEGILYIEKINSLR